MDPAASRPDPSQAEPQTRLTRARRVLAVLFSLFLGPGTGHILIGRYARALVWAVVPWAVLLSGYFITPWLFGVALVLLLVCLVDAAVVPGPARGAPRWLHALPLCLALVVAHQAIRLSWRTLVFETYRLPANSMVPTLESGDHVVVRKTHGPIARGDIIVFASPSDPRKDFIKRVVAVGGDRVEFKGRSWFLNGKAVPQKSVPGRCRYQDSDGDGTTEERTCVASEEVLGGQHYRVVYDELEPAPTAGQAPSPVPADHVFAVGDNRDNSFDSRVMGAIPLVNVKGIAQRVIWSSGASGIRWNRMNVNLR